MCRLNLNEVLGKNTRKQGTKNPKTSEHGEKASRARAEFLSAKQTTRNKPSRRTSEPLPDVGLDDLANARMTAAYEEEFGKWEGLIEARQCRTKAGNG